MTSLMTGGGGSAVAASTHAACQRFRSTDPLLTGQSRRALAQSLGHPDTTAGIPEARWMRAMTFERLVRADDFVSPLLTTTVGQLGLPRPDSVRRSDGGVSVEVTARALAQAHLKAVHEGVSTMITGLAVPYAGFEDDTSTPVKPDFAVVVPRRNEAEKKPMGSWLIVGDAKDYERVRSRIGDGRMLKGFLQVALGAESLAQWSKLPQGMEVHPSGALAVPKNSFLQPVAVVERLDDHRAEVRARADERKTALEETGTSAWTPEHVQHVEATYDPATCTSCALFTYCRAHLRASADPMDLLVEIGIRPAARAGLLPLFQGAAVDSRVPQSLVNQTLATIDGNPRWTGQRRIDQAGQPGTVNVVVAKSDSAALGIYGMGVRQHESDDWTFYCFDDPQAPGTRRAAMRILGQQLSQAMGGREQAQPGAPSPVHLVVPDGPTADLLVSIADSLAGVELSRLRWARDLEQGRTPLTFDGSEAVLPPALTEEERLGVSFLLEEDRARTMRLRAPIVNLREVLGRHVIPGGPSPDAGRLDYLVKWARAESSDHRSISDDVTASRHTPGARLANEMSDAIHNALRRRRDGAARDLARAEQLITEELTYKTHIVVEALAVLEHISESALREAFRAIEGDAQKVWRRRLMHHASDLVRFGRVYRSWRDQQVEMLDLDRSCGDRLLALSNPDLARDQAVDAGHRFLSRAVVESLTPLTVAVQGRNVQDGQCVVLIARNGEACVDTSAVDLKILATKFKLTGISAGPVHASDEPDQFVWEPKIAPIGLAVGDELILADGEWLDCGHYLKDVGVRRPSPDTRSAPKADCAELGFAEDPDNHQWCCKPHEGAEAEWSDTLAERRARGELNPQVWPPVIDIDGFDVVGKEEATRDTLDLDGRSSARQHLTMDDLD